MAPSVSAIIPALNEEGRIGATIRAAFAAGVAEVIVADGGSRDRTLDEAREAGALIAPVETMRAAQSNRGASMAGGDVLIFVHADTLLPAGAAEAVSNALDRGVIFGGFRIAFAERSLRLRLAAAMINLRTAITRCPWGDQAQFIRRETFRELGGFKPMALMEDYELAVRMRGLGKTVVLPQKVITSGRRFLAKGFVRTALMNWRIVVAYRRGADPGELARIYRAT